MATITPSTSPARRRGHGEDGIYFDAARNRYVGAISLGYGGDGRRIRRKVTGKTKAEVRQKLKDLHGDIDAGLRTPAGYTVRAAVHDWLADGLSGRSERTVATRRPLPPTATWGGSVVSLRTPRPCCAATPRRTRHRFSTT